MKQTGVIRKIDELGRIVIPKDLRTKLHIKDGELLEIYTDNDTLHLKKHSKIKELQDLSQELLDASYPFLKKDILITDTDTVIAYSGVDKKKYINKNISKELEVSIQRRESILQNYYKDLKILPTQATECSYIIDTILHDGVSIGLILMYSSAEKLNQSDMKVIKILSSFLSKYLEQ